MQKETLNAQCLIKTEKDIDFPANRTAMSDASRLQERDCLFGAR